MFCFQCEQTAGCKACAGNVGVCGKKADTAELQDKLTGALIGLARVTDGNPHLLTPQVREILRSGLALCRREPDACDRQIPAIHAMKSQLAPDCARCSHPCGKNDDFDLDLLAHDPEN